MLETNGKNEVIEVLRQANEWLRKYVDCLEKDVIIKMNRIKELESSIGVCVPCIIRCFIETCESEDDVETAKTVLKRVDNVMSHEKTIYDK